MKKRRDGNPEARLHRIGIAHDYLGVGRNVFNELFRPCVTVIEITPQVKLVDREEMDALIGIVKQACGRPPIAGALERLIRKLSDSSADNAEPKTSIDEPEDGEQEGLPGQRKDA